MLVLIHLIKLVQLLIKVETPTRLATLTIFYLSYHLFSCDLLLMQLIKLNYFLWYLYYYEDSVFAFHRIKRIPPLDT